MFVTKAFSRDPARSVAVFGCASGMPLNRLGKSKVSNSTEFLLLFISSLFYYILLASSLLSIFLKIIYISNVFLIFWSSKIFKNVLLTHELSRFRNEIWAQFFKGIATDAFLALCVRNSRRIRGNIFNREIFSRTRRVVKSYVKSVPRNLTNATLWTARKFWSGRRYTHALAKMKCTLRRRMIGERYLLERDDKGELVDFLRRREFKDEESLFPESIWIA